MDEHELTPAERQRLAEELMGWVEASGRFDDYYVNPNGGWPTFDEGHLSVDEWLPDTDPAQCGMVVKALNLCMDLEISPTDTRVVIHRLNCVELGYSDGKHHTTEAICRAALAWLDSQKEKVDVAS